MTDTKQPTLKQIQTLFAKTKTAYSKMNKMQESGTLEQFIQAKEKSKVLEKQFDEMIESVTEENPQYKEICHNGFLDGL